MIQGSHKPRHAHAHEHIDSNGTSDVYQSSVSRAFQSCDSSGSESIGQWRSKGDKRQSYFKDKDILATMKTNLRGVIGSGQHPG